jgi:hypothetical protein
VAQEVMYAYSGGLWITWRTNHETLRLRIDDSLDEPLLALLRELPEDKLRILAPQPERTESEPAFDEAVEHVLEKNAELYRRLA